MTHHVFETNDVATKKERIEKLASGSGRRILFMRTKHQAKKLARQLTAAGIPAVDLHGNLSQSARDRNLAAFKDGSTSVLVATDIAARGIHVDDVELVVHVDPPAEHKAYTHRSGRTARAGAAGTVVTVATPDQLGEVRTLAKQAGIKPTFTKVRPDAPELLAMRGERAEYVKPAPEAPVTAKPASTQRRRRASGSGTGRPVGTGAGASRSGSGGHGRRSR